MMSVTMAIGKCHTIFKGGDNRPNAWMQHMTSWPDMTPKTACCYYRTFLAPMGQRYCLPTRLWREVRRIVMGHCPACICQGGHYVPAEKVRCSTSDVIHPKGGSFAGPLFYSTHQEQRKFGGRLKGSSEPCKHLSYTPDGTIH